MTVDERKERLEQRKLSTWERPHIPRGVDNYNVVLAARQVVPQIIKRLIQLTSDPHGPTAVKACEIILNRAYGRAPVTVDITHKLTADREMLEIAAAAILEKRRAAASGRLIAPSIAPFDSALIPATAAAPDGASPRGGYAADDTPGGVERVPPVKGSGSSGSSGSKDSVGVTIDNPVDSVVKAKKRRKKK